MSSIDGQYRGPVLWICPEYIGARCRLARISSWTAGLVAVMWQGSCGCLDPFGQERERHWLVVAGLKLEPVEIDRPAVQARRRAGLESLELEAEAAQAAGKPLGGDIPRAAAGGLDLAGVHQGLEERAGRQDDRAGAIDRSSLAADARDPGAFTFGHESFDHLLAKRQVLLPLDGQLGEELVGFLVALGAGAVHRRRPCRD